MKLVRQQRRAILLILIAAVIYLLTAGLLVKSIDVRPRVTWRLPEDPEGGTLPLARFSPDGRWLATVVRHDETISGPIRIWDTITAQEKACFLPAGNPLLVDSLENCVIMSFTPDSQRLLVALAPKNTKEHETSLHVYEIETGREITSLSLRPLQDRRQSASPLCLSPDGRWLAYVSNSDKPDGQVLKLLDVPTGMSISQVAMSEFPTYTDDAFGCLTFSPDGRSLTFRIAEYDEQQSVWLISWDIQNKRERFRIRDYPDRIVFSPDSRFLVFIGYRDNVPYVRVCDASSGERMSELVGVKDKEISGLTVSQDCRYFTAGFPANGGWIWSEAFYKLMVCEMRTGGILRSFEGDTTPDKNIRFENPRNSCLPRAILRVEYRFRDEQITRESYYSILDLSSGRELLKIATEKGPHEIYVTECYGIDPKGKIFADAGQATRKPMNVEEWMEPLVPGWMPGEKWEYLIRLWDISTGQPLLPLRGCKGKFLFSPDGQMLAARGEDGTIQLWNLPPRKPLGRILAWSSVPAALVLLLGWWRGRRAKQTATS